MHPDNRLLADRLVRAAVVLTRWLRAADPAPKLSGPQASALSIIVHSGGIKPSDLATLEEVKRPTIARTIAQLEAMDLVIRKQDANDGRSVTLMATGKGRALFNAGQQRRLTPLVQALGRLSDADRRRLADAVSVIEPVLRSETETRTAARGVGSVKSG